MEEMAIQVSCLHCKVELQLSHSIASKVQTVVQGQYRVTIACCRYHKASLTKSSGQTLVCLIELHKPGGLSLGLQAAIASRVPVLFCLASWTVEIPCSINDRQDISTSCTAYCRCRLLCRQSRKRHSKSLANPSMTYSSAGMA